MSKTFKQLISDILPDIEELFPWDLEVLMEEDPTLLLVDIREIDEFDSAYIKGSLHVPRGILEAACDWDYSDTIPNLVNARERNVVVICRSGNRSALAAFTLQLMGYKQVTSLQTGVKGWNDSDLPLLNKVGEIVDADWAETFLSPPVTDSQCSPE